MEGKEERRFPSKRSVLYSSHTLPQRCTCPIPCLCCGRPAGTLSCPRPPPRGGVGTHGGGVGTHGGGVAGRHSAPHGRGRSQKRSRPSRHWHRLQQTGREYHWKSRLRRLQWFACWFICLFLNLCLHAHQHCTPAHTACPGHHERSRVRPRRCGHTPGDGTRCTEDTASDGRFSRGWFLLNPVFHYFIENYPVNLIWNLEFISMFSFLVIKQILICFFFFFFFSFSFLF